VLFLLVMSLTQARGTSGQAIQTLGLLAIALVVYAWMLFPASGGATFAVLVGLSLLWAWATHPTPPFAGELAAFGVLSATAIWQRRWRSRKLQRMQQLLDDIGEERTVKEQAIASASQARAALQKKLARYTQLQTIAEELSNLTDLHSVARLAVERAFALIGKSDVCLLFLVDPDQQELALFASKRRESLPAVRAKHGDQFDRHVLRSHRPLIVNDVRRDFRFTVGVSSERDVSSVIACPLVLGQSPAGVLRLDTALPSAYTQDDLRFLDILLDLIGAAIMNARLFARTQQLAMTDGLTGLTLRRPFMEQLDRELARAGRSRDPVSVILLDVDHFKRYNDSFGHTAGDLILKGVAEVLRTVAPPGSTVARYGGEEFIVLLPRTSRRDAAELAENLRRLITQQVRGSQRTPPAARFGSRRERSEDPVVTVSLGVATFPEDAQAELGLLRVADSRLYQAKHAGRNQVVSA
jgi:diguanylate cyclase (GGDEF)-like protein